MRDVNARVSNDIASEVISSLNYVSGRAIFARKSQARGEYCLSATLRMAITKKWPHIQYSIIFARTMATARSTFADPHDGLA